MALAQKVTQREWDADAIELMAPCVAMSPYAGIDGPRDVFLGSHLWELREGGQHVFLAVRGTVCEGGRLLEVTGMRSLGERVHSQALAEAMNRLAREVYPGVDMLAMTTRHAHLVRGCERDGWAAVATVVTKNLRIH